MPVTLEQDRVLLQAQEIVDALWDAANEFPEDALSMTRGMVNGLVAGLIFWAIVIYLLI